MKPNRLRRIEVNERFSLEYLDSEILHALTDITDTLIDLKNCEFLPPTHIVNILFVISYLSSRGDQVIIRPPKNSSNLNMFLQYIGFYDILRSLDCDVIGYTPINHKISYRENKLATNNSIQYIRKNQTEYFYETQKLLITAFGNSSRILHSKIPIIFLELISNIINHSNSFGFSSFFMNKRGAIEIVIGDIGIGILNSLIKFGCQMFEKWNIDFKGDLDEKRAIALAFAPGFTTSDQNNQKFMEFRGMGLYYVTELIKASKGTLICRSGRTKMICKTMNNQFDQIFIEKLPFFPGVQYEIFLNTNSLEFLLY